MQTKNPELDQTPVTISTIKQALREVLEDLPILADQPKHEQLLTMREATGIAGVSLSTAYRDPDFPKPVKVGRPGRNGQVRCSRYPLSEVQAYIARRIAARDAERVQQ